MSFYNMLHGVNPFSKILLGLLGTDLDGVPRFRDCFLTDKEIVVYTRTGGGNRDSYDNAESRMRNYPDLYTAEEAKEGPFNDDLRALPGFLRDDDDEYDTTYARFYFAVPEHGKRAVELLRDMGAGNEDPKLKWERLIEALQSGDKTNPLVKKSMDVMAPLFKQIKEVLENPSVGE